MDSKRQVNQFFDLQSNQPLLNRLQPDDCVKLSFEAHDPECPGIVGESIWLIVNRWDGKEGVGESNNVRLRLPCSIGQQLAFEACHIIDDQFNEYDQA